MNRTGLRVLRRLRANARVGYRLDLLTICMVLLLRIRRRVKANYRVGARRAARTGNVFRVCKCFRSYLLRLILTTLERRRDAVGARTCGKGNRLDRQAGGRANEVVLISLVSTVPVCFHRVRAALGAPLR